MPEVKIIHADCLDWAASQLDNSYDSCVTDPPSGTAFMGKNWDSFKGRADFIEFIRVRFKQVYRILKPGAYTLVWALPRTSHWTATGLEDSGFIIKDVITHLFGSGYPKNYNIAKGIEQVITGGGASWNNFHTLPGVKGEPEPTGLGGLNRANLEQGYRPAQYSTHGTLDLDAQTPEGVAAAGLGTALKPANEHWILCQKPIEAGGYARNVLKWGTGALNIAACSVGTEEIETNGQKTQWGITDILQPSTAGFTGGRRSGRWPANLVLSHTLFCVQVGSAEVKADDHIRHNSEADRPTAAVYGWSIRQTKGIGTNGLETVPVWDCAAGCPVAELDKQSGTLTSGARKPYHKNKAPKFKNVYGKFEQNNNADTDESSGGASRFFPQFGFTDEERALFLYAAKPAKSEKNAGLESLPEKPKVFNGSSDRPSKQVLPGSVEDKFSRPAANIHPTVKSTALMGWLMRLITPAGGSCFDMFAGSASGGVAAVQEGFNWTGIELDESYLPIARARLDFAKLPPEVQNARPGQSFIDWFSEHEVNYR